jgi:hypothetical protein
MSGRSTCRNTKRCRAFLRSIWTARAKPQREGRQMPKLEDDIDRVIVAVIGGTPDVIR